MKIVSIVIIFTIFIAMASLSTAQAYFPGDFDADGDVDGKDLAILIANPGQLDITTFLQYFGKTTAGTFAKLYIETEHDRPYAIRVTEDGGYITAGRVTPENSLQSSHIRIMKLSTEGIVTWRKSYLLNNYDEVNKIEQTTDGGYIISGGTGTASPYYRTIWIAKLDASGNPIWQYIYDNGSPFQHANTIKHTRDGNYIACGYVDGLSSYKLLVIKLDSSGNVLWNKVYPYSGSSAYSIQETSDGGFIVLGRSTGALILKLNANGEPVWQKQYGSSSEYLYSVQQISDGYIVIGDTYETSNDVWIMKLDDSGNPIWQKKYDVSGGDDEGRIILQTSAGDFIVGAYTTYSGQQDFWLFKIDTNGAPIWQKRYGGSKRDQLWNLALQGPYIVVVGESESFSSDADTWIIKATNDGDINFNSSSGAAVSNTAASVSNTSKTITSLSMTPSVTSFSVTNSSASITDVAVSVTVQAP